MIGMFDRYISIDWAGGGTEHQRVNVRVVEAYRGNEDEGIVVDPPTPRGA